ncbi:hypothetical protein [Photobacterium phosphoreum]|uniref:hypothetical protein n=1 Tax=Photobacterium phosphoreum TaxID=659 RepID=UPI001E5C9E1F|nr:hypothetical protein [Photobacterium phosphoreum]MCD9507943.1 hypothetical protein [Photobacterium phosphoreum]
MEQLLRTLKDYGAFDNEEQKVSGIAQLAIDNGFDNLSKLQQKVLAPFIEMACTGSTNPGGHHNNCDNIISGTDLVDAIELSDDGLDGIQCDNCRSDDGYYQHQQDRLDKE